MSQRFSTFERRPIAGLTGACSRGRAAEAAEGCIPPDVQRSRASQGLAPAAEPRSWPKVARRPIASLTGARSRGCAAEAGEGRLPKEVGSSSRLAGRADLHSLSCEPILDQTLSPNQS